MLGQRSGRLLRGFAPLCRLEFEERSFQTIPVIDIAALVQDKDAAAKASVARQLDEACKNAGFFYVLNHGIPQDVTEGVLKEARNWFHLPEARKHEIALSSRSSYRGYQSLGSNVTRYKDSFQRDWHEAIDLYREGKVGTTEDSPVHGNNPWPVQLPAFDSVLRQYISSCLQLGQTIMRGIALGMGLPERAFEEAEAGATTAETSYWVTRVIHYPPLAEGSAHEPDLAGAAAQGAEMDRSVQLSCGEHTDYGLLTLVNQEGSLSALQVKNQAGQWIDAKPIPDPSRSRVSCPFFYEPAFDAVVKPIQQLLGADRPSFRPVQYGKHLESKVLSNFELEVDQKAAAGYEGTRASPPIRQICPLIQGPRAASTLLLQLVGRGMHSQQMTFTLASEYVPNMEQSPSSGGLVTSSAGPMRPRSLQKASRFPDRQPLRSSELEGLRHVAPSPFSALSRAEFAHKSVAEQTSQCYSPPHQRRHVEAKKDREEDRGAAEIQSIMQRGKVRESPPTTFLGISPPRRSAGAANPLVQDWNWRSNAYKCSHSNLQALREIDARGVSFLRMNGDSALLIESPEQGGLVIGASDSSASTSYFSGSRNSCQVSSHRVQAKPMVCQVGFNVA